MEYDRSVEFLGRILSSHDHDSFEDEWKLALIERLDALIEVLQEANGPGDEPRNAPYFGVPNTL